MCGITGIVSPSQRQVIAPMTDAIAHRGPDACGYYRDEHVALGSRRLSIIDLTTGNQPIANEAGNLQLVCNGEIYNSPDLRRQLMPRHQFRTRTDIEVILHLYEDLGTDCVKHLRGMFAFAIWDKNERRLFLARDHMGQKPLFFCAAGEHFLFASEVKSILASGLVAPEIDLEGLWHYVSMRFMPDRYSLFKGIQKLPAGNSLSWQEGTFKLERYWDLCFTAKHQRSEREIADELDALLSETVRMHLLSDVQVGAFLSGGIDSSLVSAMMAKASGEPIPAFSIGVQEQGFDELPYARQVVARYGMEAHERVVQADLIRLIPAMVHHMDEPADPFGAGVYLVSGVAREVVKVALTGDGGDESFAGYDRFAGQRLLDYYCLLPEWFRRTLVQKLVERMPDSFGYKSAAQKARWLNELSLYSRDERYAHSMSFLRFTQDAKQQLFTEGAKREIEDYDSTQKILTFFDSPNVGELIDRMLYTDLMTRMPDHLLVTVDRMSMAHSLEARSPLVDYRVVEYAAAIPGNIKLRGGQLKYILKKVAARYLPAELIERKKQGFGFPLALWMRTELRQFIRNLFAESRFVQLGIFEPAYVDRLIKQHIAGQVDHNYRLWLLINLEIWYRLNFEARGVEAMRADIERLMGKDPARASAFTAPDRTSDRPPKRAATVRP
ncbi:MAG TPA: asparagine synthase (glutamine-hydrolyzing) [Geminicoccaceae bacterium]